MTINCPFKNLCIFCSEYCCLFKTYSNKDFKICKDIGLCPNLHLCENALNGNLEKKSLISNIIPILDNINTYDYTVKKPFNNFNTKFIPRVEVYGKKSINQMKVINKLGIRTIVMSLSRMISNKEDQILKQKYNCDLHDKFHYDGRILLQTIIPDSYCIKIMEKYKEYKKALKVLNPDIITTFDANFYLDQPLFATFIQLFNILKANSNICNIDIPQIFLLPPVSLKLFKSIFSVFLRSNHKSACIPLGDFKKSDTPHILKLMDIINFYRETSNKEFKVFLISKNPDKRIYADCYSSNTWAKNNRSKNKKNPLRNMEKNLQKTIKRASKIRFQKTLRSFFKKR